jgi:hypothetical protein
MRHGRVWEYISCKRMGQHVGMGSMEEHGPMLAGFGLYGLQKGRLFEAGWRIMVGQTVLFPMTTASRRLYAALRPIFRRRPYLARCTKVPM